MAGIADISVDLRLLTASFEASAKRAQAETKKMREGIEGLRGTVDSATGFLRNFGIALGVREIIGFGVESLRAAADLGELSQQLGVSTDGLQTYQYAARQSGVSTDQLEAALAKLTQRIGDAAAGNKEAIDAFNLLGVGVLDAQGKIRSTDDVLGDVADSLSRIPDPARRAASEVDLFGRSGQRLDTILASGRAGLQEFGRQAQATGQIIASDLITNADSAVDAIDAMQGSFSKLAATLLAKVAPALKSAADDIRVFFGGGTLQEEIDQLKRTLSNPWDVQTIIDEKGLKEQLQTLEEIQRLASLPHPSLAPTTTSNPTPTTGGKGAARGAGSRAADIEEIRDQTAALQEYIIGLEQERQALALTGAARAEYEAMIRASAAAQADYDAGLRDSPLLTGEEVAAIKANVDALVQMQQQAQATHDTVQQKTADSTVATVDLTNSLENLTNALADGATGAQTWGDVWQSVLHQIIGLIFQMLQAAAGGKGGGGIGGGIFGSLLGAIGLGGGGGGIGAPTRFGGVFAAGGTPPVGVPSLVGENGPELFVPRTAGTILPNGFQPAGGGVVVNQVNHYDLRGTDISRTELDQKIKKSQQETYKAVFTGIAGGGTESKAVGRRKR